MKKILMIMFCMVLLISSVSATNFDNVKSYDGETKTATITNWFGLGSEIATVKLIYNTEQCLINCESVMEVNLNTKTKGSSFIEGFKFLDSGLKETSIDSFEVMIYETEEKQKIVPTYKEVCTGITGHAETIEVVFDPGKTTFEKLARLFFEIHDPTQKNRQGPDVGAQYRSAVFYLNEAQKKTAEKLIALLRERGYDVATEVTAASTFWPAEDYHQDYLAKHSNRASCQVPVQRFGPTTQPASGSAR